MEELFSDVLFMANHAISTVRTDPSILYIFLGPLVLCFLIFFSIISYSKSRTRKAIAKSEEPIQPEIAESKDAQTTEPVSEETSGPVLPSEVSEVKSVDDESWIKRLKGGLEKTRSALTTNFGSILSNKTALNDEVLEQIHEVLFRADIGVQTTDTLVEHLKSSIPKDQAADWSMVRDNLKTKVTSILSKSQTQLNIPSNGPWVILVVGVNGVGKTTSIGKLAAHFLAEEKSVLLCAADTFRAAAIDQLKVWGDRLGVDVIAHKEGSDPAAVAYDGLKAAIARKHDVLIIDTAGRLHSKKELMEELAKIKKVLSKDIAEAPHETWLVIDATMGQNAVQQTKAFNEIVNLSGLVVTKLDGTAKGGVLIGVSDQFNIPIRYLGVGEKVGDLRSFKPEDYSDSLFN